MNVFNIDPCFLIIEFADKDNYIEFGRINKQTNTMYKKSHGVVSNMEKTYTTRGGNGVDIVPIISVNNQDDASKWCTFAVKKQRMDMLLTFRNNNFPYNTDCTLAAAESGDLKLLKWLVLDTCPWDQRVILRAAVLDFEDIVDWAVEFNNTSVDYVNYFLP